MNYSKQEKEEARISLMQIIKPGDTLYTILRHVSSSGMSRNISVIKIGSKGEKYHLDWSVSRVLGYPLAKSEGVKIGGCGMDMGFAIINSLSYALYHNYKCIGEKCQSGDHVNRRGDDGELPPYKRDGKTQHRDGYALRQEWL